MAGKQYGHWLVLHQAGNAPGGGALWACRCKCGTERSVMGSDMRSGKSVSCGCEGSRATMGVRRKTHGDARTRLYGIWKGMNARCAKEKFVHWHGRGIRVCESWKTYENFRDWAVGAGYKDDLSIERLDNNSDYAPTNCVWANKTVQARNKQQTLRAPDGRAWADIAEENGIPGRVFRCRYYNGGWPAEIASTWPVGKRRLERKRKANGQWDNQPANWRR